MDLIIIRQAIHMACEHIAISSSQPNYLSPYIAKTTWVCLFDACFKIKKTMAREELLAYGEKMQSPHRVMINCETLEIFCTICNKEIYDDIEQPAQSAVGSSQSSNSKHKKVKKINLYNIRQYLLQSNQSESFFAGNSQYPPSFQKQKRGLCGLKTNAINAYLNSVVHLLAYVPSLIEVARNVDLEKIDNKVIRLALEAIDNIWSGKYRVYSINELETQIIKSHHNFLSYSYKTPQNALYFILKNLLEQFSFEELPCASNCLISEPYYEWSGAQAKVYSLMKQTFGGECILEKVCSNCGNLKTTTNRFECLKVNYESIHYHETSFKGFLLGLIEEALNWKNSHQTYAQKLENGKLRCEKCQKNITDFCSYVNLPNNLILEFGQDLNGLNICPPDELDLFKFTSQAVKDQERGEAIYDYIACISRQNKRFFTHVRNYASKKETTFSDESLFEKERPHHNVKIVVYKRRKHLKHHQLLKNIMSCLEVNVNPIVPLPDFWSIYLKEHYEVPALVNPFICSHGKLRANLAMSKMKKGPQRIPVEIYRYLLEVFGGRDIVTEHSQDFCKVCEAQLQAVQEIKASEKEMAAFADKLSHKKDRVLINRQWLEKWKNFIYSDNKKGYKILGNPRPGHIDNRELPGIDLQTSHKRISPQVWYFLHKFYGGGPRLSQKDYKPNIVVKTSVNLRYESLKESFLALQILHLNEKPQFSEAYSKKIDELAQEHDQTDLA